MFSKQAAPQLGEQQFSKREFGAFRYQRLCRHLFDKPQVRQLFWPR
jgi:hypothetical protein